MPRKTTRKTYKLKYKRGSNFSRSTAPVAKRAQSYVANPPKTLTYKGIGLPERYRCKLVYDYEMDHIASATADIPTQQVLRLNSVYDPDQTGIGGQPPWYDLLAGVYDSYRVIGCSYIISIVNTSTAHSFRVQIARAGEVISTASSLNGLSKTSVHQLGSLYGSPKLTVKGSCNTMKDLGLTRTNLGVNCDSLVNASPALQNYLIMRFTPYVTASAGRITGNVRLIYDVVFARKDQSSANIEDS